MDEAHRSVQSISSKGVWHNMARMCVKTRRLDVAQICMSKLSSAKGASQRIASSLFLDADDERMVQRRTRTPTRWRWR